MYRRQSSVDVPTSVTYVPFLHGIPRSITASFVKMQEATNSESIKDMYPVDGMVCEKYTMMFL